MGGVGGGTERELKRGRRECAEVSEEPGGGPLSRQITRSIINGPHPRRANPGRVLLSSTRLRRTNHDYFNRLSNNFTGYKFSEASASSFSVPNRKQMQLVNKKKITSEMKIGRTSFPVPRMSRDIQYINI